jgi:hypothetical protein
LHAQPRFQGEKPVSEKQAKQIAGLGANASGRIVEITDDHETLVIAFVPATTTAEHPITTATAMAMITTTTMMVTSTSNATRTTAAMVATS